MFFLLAALVRVLLCTVLLLGMFSIKKTRFRHVPIRRTRISRHYGETTLWLERLTNAVLDMVHCSMTQKEAEEEAVAAEKELKAKALASDKAAAPLNHTTTTTAYARPTDLPPLRSPHHTPEHSRTGVSSWSGTYPSRGYSAEAAAGGSQEEEDGQRATRHKYIVTLEERINAMLEDSGIAAWADFHVDSVGHTAPRVKAIHLTNGAVPSNNISSGSGATAAGTGGGTSPGTTPSTVPGGGGVSPGGLSTSVPSAGGVGSTTKRTETDRYNGATRSPTSTPIVGTSTAAPQEASLAAAGTASTLDLEIEIEYSGDVEFSLKADVSFARGRRLPVYARVSNVRLVRVHARAQVALQFDDATLETPRIPYLQCILWLESDPVFDMELNTSLTRFNIQNFFLIPNIAKFFLLRYLRSKMKRNRGEGINVRVPLPEDVVDCGEQWWCNMVRDTASEGISHASTRFKML